MSNDQELLEEKLRNAQKFAEQGDATIMECSLSLAQTYARKVGRDISDDVRRVEQIGYQNAVPIKLSDAQKWAEQGDATIMECSLSLAQTYARKVGIDISSDVERIQDICKKTQ